MMNNKKIYILLASLLILIFPIGFSVEIVGCSSGAEIWKCEQNKLCTCVVSGECTDGNLLVYEGGIYNILCLPSINPEDGIAAINLDLCGNPTGEIRVRANCLEGQSLEKRVTIYAPVTTTTITTTTTTTIAIETTTTLKYCSEQGESCERLDCCRGLECCDDMICREACPSKGINIWLIIVPVIGILAVVIAFVLLRRSYESE
ncbi:MAG: hypothetical protein QXQ40_02135 [Candidatus Aenigmatarchaeota archaeon]